MATVRHLGLFPFCVPEHPPRNSLFEIPTGSGTPYPLRQQITILPDLPPVVFDTGALPIADCCLMWWVVKKWKLSFVLELYEDLLDPPGSYARLLPTPFEFVLPQSENEGTLYMQTKSENALVCMQDIEAASFASGTTFTTTLEVYLATDPPVFTTTQRNIAVMLTTNYDYQNQGFNPPFVRLQKSDPLYKSHLAAALRIQIGIWDSDITNSDAFGSPVNADLKMRQTEKGTIQMQKTQNIQSPSIYQISDVVLEATEYREYDPRDGKGPIYDKFTGKQLRPFPD
jgi:hypothetical protein